MGPAGPLALRGEGEMIPSGEDDVMTDSDGEGEPEWVEWEPCPVPPINFTFTVSPALADMLNQKGVAEMEAAKKILEQVRENSERVAHAVRGLIEWTHGVAQLLTKHEGYEQHAYDLEMRMRGLQGVAEEMQVRISEHAKLEAWVGALEKKWSDANEACCLAVQENRRCR